VLRSLIGTKRRSLRRKQVDRKRIEAAQATASRCRKLRCHQGHGHITEADINAVRDASRWKFTKTGEGSRLALERGRYQGEPKHYLPHRT